jgi:hypothetical protein
MTTEEFKPTFEDRTGPASKTKTLRARLWSGVYAETHTLQHEHQDELQEIRDEYYARHPPASPEARCLVDQIIMCEWHLRRFFVADDALWTEFHLAAADSQDPYAVAARQGANAFGHLQHRINSTRRELHTALRELERLEARDRDVEHIAPPETELTSTITKPIPTVGTLRKSS